MSSSSSRSGDPFPGFAFKVQIDGVIEAHFSEVSGLSMETEVVEYQEGGLNTHTHKLKGQSKYSNIVLKRGVTTSKAFFDWMHQSVKNEMTKNERKAGAIILFDDDGVTDVRQWNFVKAWPCKWEGPSFDANQSQALVETLELAHEGLTIQ